ncbi:hypothetical protein ABT301_04755 [Streptomyces sp. NPDC000987]|uniref:hypothetical protein n=1 Tax=Streptomyces sp. NPDC000987 TaxID=3154374 RepID=UPI003330823F
MPPTPPHPHSATSTSTTGATTTTVQEALAARDGLAYALSQAGIQLPAMDIRTPWADDHEGDIRYALVHLGVCSAPVALLLADVILKGVGK